MLCLNNNPNVFDTSCKCEKCTTPEKAQVEVVGQYQDAVRWKGKWYKPKGGVPKIKRN